MTTFRDVGAVRPFNATVYTDSNRVTGELRSNQPRFTDAMNARGEEYLVLFDSTVQGFNAPAGEEIATPATVIRKDGITLATPREAMAGVERPLAAQGMKRERVLLPSLVAAWPFTIRGMLHLPPGVDILQHVYDPANQFMAVTDATIDYHPSPLLGFKAQFVLVNRRKLELVIDMSRKGERAAVDPDMLRPKVVETALTPERAAELLTATGLFKGIALPALQQACKELLDQGRISRKQCAEAAEVFHQGDVGDTLYVVESGRLTVIVADRRTQAERHVADYGTGDFFGEMAVLGEGRRSATVRAVTSAGLMAIQEDAVKRLLQRFPSAASNMLGIMIERRLALDAAAAGTVPR